MRPFLLCFALASMNLCGQLVVRIDDAPATTMSSDMLGKLSRHTAVVNEHGKQVSYEGVLLRDVLIEAGLEFPAQLHGTRLSSYVRALATDSYEVVYAMAELDPSLTDGELLVVDKREGQPLPANFGPLQIVASRDKRPARAVRMVKEVDVVHLKR